MADRLAWVFDDMAWIAYGPRSSYGGNGAQFLSPRHPILVDVQRPGFAPRRAVPTTTTAAEIARRTLRPVGGVFLAVYDGAFYGGSIVATAQLRDGRTVTERIPASRG